MNYYHNFFSLDWVAGGSTIALWYMLLPSVLLTKWLLEQRKLKFSNSHHKITGLPKLRQIHAPQFTNFLAKCYLLNLLSFILNVNLDGKI